MTLAFLEGSDAAVAYHVVSGKVMAVDVVELEAPEALNGQRIDIKTSGESVYVDGASVVTADIKASNGVIHL